MCSTTVAGAVVYMPLTITYPSCGRRAGWGVYSTESNSIVSLYNTYMYSEIV